MPIIAMMDWLKCVVKTGDFVHTLGDAHFYAITWFKPILQLAGRLKTVTNDENKPWR